MATTAVALAATTTTSVQETLPVAANNSHAPKYAAPSRSTTHAATGSPNQKKMSAFTTLFSADSH
jgi:hypothetical protein